MSHLTTVGVACSAVCEATRVQITGVVLCIRLSLEHSHMVLVVVVSTIAVCPEDVQFWKGGIEPAPVALYNYIFQHQLTHS